MSGKISKTVRLRKLCERWGWTCHICGWPIPHEWEEHAPNAPSADHLVPQLKGGTRTGNILPAHQYCNSRRGDRETTSVSRINMRRGFTRAMAEYEYGRDEAAA